MTGRRHLTLLAALLTLASGSLRAEESLLVPSLTLEEFEQRALKNGIEGRRTELSLESAGYSRDIAFRLTDAPKLSAAYTYQRAGQRIDDFKTNSTGRDAALTLQQPTPLGTDFQVTAHESTTRKPGYDATVTQPLYLFTWNPALRGRREADLNFANAKDTFDSSVLSIRSQARSLYYSVLQADESILVEQRKVAASKKLLDVTDALVTAGKLPPVETTRAKIRLQSDDRQLQNAMATREKAVARAKNYVLYPLDQSLRFVSKLEFRPIQITSGRLVEYALLHRPTLRSLRRTREIARLDIQQAMEPTRPALTFRGGYQYTENGAISEGWNWSGAATWTFFDSFVTSKRVRQARIAELVAGLNLMNSERTTRVDVQNAYIDLKRAERQIRDFNVSRDQSKRNVEVLRLRFQNGLERIIDVFDAENEMRNLDNEYLGLLVQFNESKDQLSELIGTDVETVQ